MSGQLAPPPSRLIPAASEAQREPSRGKIMAKWWFGLVVCLGAGCGVEEEGQPLPEESSIEEEAWGCGPWHYGWDGECSTWWNACCYGWSCPGGDEGLVCD
jgi:hypothetical protein